MLHHKRRGESRLGSPVSIEPPNSRQDSGTPARIGRSILFGKGLGDADFVALRLFLVLLLLAVVPATYATSGSSQYVYDPDGRLVAAIDALGNAATYQYDAVGNLLAISTTNSSSVSIFALSPNNGPVGTSVTIYGDGFSTTPSQNTVTFNGTAATVSSSTLTTIVTTVPTGATTGTVSVTSPNGSANSPSPFTVQ